MVEHHYNFCAWLLPKISKFQKDQRYLLGARLENAALDILEYLINASVTEGATNGRVAYETITMPCVSADTKTMREFSL